MQERLFKFRFLLLGLILILGLLLRQNNLYTWPRLGATFDEYAWVWLGMNLIQNHVPESWSRHPQYKDTKTIIYQKTQFVLAKPYLEHPPVFGLVAGSFALLSGVKDMYHVDINHIRNLALLMGVLSIFLIYIFAAQVYGYKVGLIASLIYSITPTIAVGSRLVENENFFIPMFLLALYLTARFVKSNNSWLRNLAAIICGVLALAKLPWLAGALGIFLILFFLRRYKDGLKFIGVVIPISLLFVIYGIYYDANVFFSLLQFQMQRYDLTFNSFFAIFTSPYLADRFLVDGWIYFGWFALFLLAAKDFKKHLWVIIPFLAYLMVFVFAIPNEPSHGWYRYPFYPFLTISTAVFLKEYFNKNYFLSFLFLLFTGLSMLQLSWAQSLGFSFIIFRGFLLIFGISLIPLFFPKSVKIAAIVNYCSLAIIFILSIWSINNYNEQ